MEPTTKKVRARRDQRRAISLRPYAIAGAALAAAAPPAARAGIDNTANTDGAQRTVISTTGATALGAFNTAVAGNRRILNLGTSELYIGNTQYTIAAGDFLSEVLSPVNGNDATALPSPPNAAGQTRQNTDRWAYTFHQTGSVEGILELANGYGLNGSGTVILPGNPTTSNPVFVSGNRFDAVGSNNGHTVGAGYTINGAVSAPRIAWSDVRSVQAFATSGTANAGNAPGAAGYGLGAGNRGTRNFQQLQNVAAIPTPAGGTTGNDHFRNETVAVVPFTISANPGTGLETITRDEARFLNAHGRMPNGANFNFVTRDIGSGTRNQAGNNLNLDPSFADGERDRVATSAFTGGTTGTAYAAGDEVSPLDGIPGSFGVQNDRFKNEDRISPQIKFGDKTSGSSRVRPVLRQSRMSVGVISAGDLSVAGGGGDGYATAANGANQLRVLAIDWNADQDGTGGADGAVQPTADNVTTGRYRMWSAAQAITVKTEAEIAGGVDQGLIRNDAADTGPDARSPHRKFLDNVFQSSSNYPNDGTAGDSTTAGPADGIIRGGFILPQWMAVTKPVDGAAQTNRVRPDQAGYQTYLAETAGAVSTLNWAQPAAIPGYDKDGGGDVKYNVFNANNFTNTPDKIITITQRTALAGDFNNDKVRDLADVAKLAQARVNAGAYLASSEGAAVGVGTGTASASDGLIVLGDLDSTGAFDKADARAFLYGASVDTSGFNADPGTAVLPAVPGETAADRVARNRQANGVRLGQLRKNAAVASYNAEVAALGGPASERFNRFDVNNDGVVNRVDARVVDRNVGRSYTSFDDVSASADDLVSAELGDNNTITHVDPNTAASSGVAPGADLAFTSPADLQVKLGNDSDFQQVRAFLGEGLLLDGDTTFDGTVDVVDLGIFSGNFGDAGKWSDGDFTFDGAVDVVDLGLLAGNFGDTAAFLTALEAYPELAEAYAAVPEPSALGVLAAAATALGRRRRRHHA